MGENSERFQSDGVVMYRTVNGIDRKPVEGAPSFKGFEGRSKCKTVCIVGLYLSAL